MRLRWRNRQKFKQQHFRTPIDHRSLSGHFRTVDTATRIVNNLVRHRAPVLHCDAYDPWRKRK
jgi:hypothetical protein